MDASELPQGVGMALAQNTHSMELFCALSEAEKQAVLDGAKTLRSAEEMRAYLYKTLRGE